MYFSFKHPILEYYSEINHLLFLQIHSLAAINGQLSTSLVFALFFLLFLSFVISGAEVAYFSLTHRDINVLKTKTQSSYKRIINLLEEPKVLLGCMVIASSFINIAIIIISNILLGDFLALEKFDLLWVEVIIKVVSISTTLILFCEVLPKVMAAQNNIRFANDVGIIIEFIYLVLKRASIWFVKYSEVIERKITKKKGTYNLEELDNAIDHDTESKSTVEERNILKGIVKFGNITVKQIMKTRIDVHGIEKTTDFTTLINLAGELHYSRLPVYDDDLDKVIGMIHTKDLLPFINEGRSFDWHKLLRVPFFIHEKKLIEDLLKEFQSKRIHFAVVVDEFGGTSGIVTLEDILEEVIGDIKDEFDEEEIDFVKIDDHNYIFEGKTMLNDVCKAMQLDPDIFNGIKGESDSLAGLVLEIKGEIPEVGQIIPTKDFNLEILEVEKNRLIKIKISIKEQSN